MNLIGHLCFIVDFFHRKIRLLIPYFYFISRKYLLEVIFSWNLIRFYCLMFPLSNYYTSTNIKFPQHVYKPNKITVVSLISLHSKEEEKTRSVTPNFYIKVLQYIDPVFHRSWRKIYSLKFRHPSYLNEVEFHKLSHDINYLPLRQTFRLSLQWILYLIDFYISVTFKTSCSDDLYR